MQVNRILVSLRRHPHQDWPPFLALFTDNELSASEQVRLRKMLGGYHCEGGPFMRIEFSGCEIHLYPSQKACADCFMKLRGAVKEFEEILRLFGLDDWIGQIEMDSNIVPFDERIPIPDEVSMLTTEYRISLAAEAAR